MPAHCELKVYGDRRRLLGYRPRSSWTSRNRVQIAGQYGVNREQAVTIDIEALSSVPDAY
jgi:hypothetical protein